VNVSAPGSPLVLLAPDPLPSAGLAPRSGTRASRAAVSRSATVPKQSSAPGAPHDPIITSPALGPERGPQALRLGGAGAEASAEISESSAPDFSGMLNDLQATTVEALNQGSANHDSAVRPQPGTANRTTANASPIGMRIPTAGRAQCPSAPSSGAPPWAASAQAIPTGKTAPSRQGANAGLALPKEPQATAASPRVALPPTEQVASTLQLAHSAAADVPLRAAAIFVTTFAETPPAPERPQPRAADSQPKAHLAPAPVASTAPAPISPATAAPEANHASAQESGNAAESAVQDPLPEPDAASMNLSPEEIAFGARLVARDAEQPSGSAIPTSRPVVAERLVSAVTASGTSPETATHVVPSGNATSTAATQEKSDPTPETNAQAPVSQRTGHSVPYGTSIAHADQPSTSASGNHLPTQEAGYAPSPARPPETGTAAPSTLRAPLAAAGPGVRGPETAVPDAPATGAARDIALRLKADDNSAVEVRLSERGGEVRVAVRSADPDLAESMRARLPELVDRLGTRGYETEIWRPQQPAAPERSGTGPNPDSQREQPGEQQSGNGKQKQDQSQPEWMEEMTASLRQPNAAKRSTNR
jgi:hypothetical protein